MQKRTRKLNDESGTVIEEEFLKEEPIAPEPLIVQSKVIPEMETIIFNNELDPGTIHEFSYINDKTGIPATRYVLVPGKEYTLPVEVIEHLEECGYPIPDVRTNQYGLEETYYKGVKRRFSCRRVRRK